jgi:hypothetical protein
MTNSNGIQLLILPGRDGEPPMVRHDGASVTDDTDAAMVARAMLQSAAYMFAQGQPVAFGPEIPSEVLR